MTEARKMTRDAAGEIVPPVDIAETEEGAVLRMEMPGARPDTLSVTVESDTLTVVADRQDCLAGCQALRRECGAGVYRRSFGLSRDLSRDDITADYKLGVLTVRIPKAEHTIPKRIEVQ
jgi:HSP20 family molecular chaperone IbpA